MSRIKNFANNLKWSYIGTIFTIVTGFAVRTVFIYTLGKTLLGLSSLYASVIGVLSIAELGIGSILNTQLYKPVAEHDEESIIAIIQLYKKLYTIIAVFIAVIGILIIPFMDKLIKNLNEIPNFKIYYIFYLFNTVITYFVSYKFSISNAEQKNYINTNFDTIFTLTIYLGQIVALVVFKDYFAFLLIQSLILLVKNLFVSSYLNRKYPLLIKKDWKKLHESKAILIRKNLFAGVMNKFADSAINQTDSLLISAFVSITSLGVVSNYTTLRTYVEKFTKPLLDQSGSIIGNFVHTENESKKRLLIKTLQFYSFWIYGFVSLALFFLSTPFVRIWVGDDYVIPNNIVFVICLNLMLSGIGDRPYVLFKNSHGKFYDDWHIVIFTSFVNLFTSVLLVFPLGILGVFLGTTATIITSVIWRPFIFYKKATGEKVYNYFIRLFIYYLLVIITGLICSVFLGIISKTDSKLLYFVYKMLIVILIPNCLWYLLFYRSQEFQYMKSLVLSLSKNKGK